jgi:hypothetical protein
MLCQDEKAYQAYMNYIEAQERAGKMADPDKAMDEILNQLEKDAAARWNRNPWDDDKTLSTHTPSSSFFCSPADNEK